MINRIEQAKHKAETERRLRQLLNGYEPDEEETPDETALKLAEGWGYNKDSRIHNRNVSGRSIEEVLENIKDKNGPCMSAEAKAKLPKKAPMSVAEIEDKENEAKKIKEAFMEVIEARKTKRSPSWHSQDRPSYNIPNYNLRRPSLGTVYRATFRGGPRDGEVVDLDPRNTVPPRFVFPYMDKPFVTYWKEEDPPSPIASAFKFHVYTCVGRQLDPARDMEYLLYQYEGVRN